MSVKHSNAFRAFLRRGKSILFAVCLIATMLMPAFSSMTASADGGIQVLHIWAGVQGWTNDAVALESGEAYTFNAYYYAAGSSAGIIFGGKRLITGLTAEEGVTYDADTSRVSYTFTADTDSAKLQLVTYYSGSLEVAKDSGMQYGDVHAWLGNPTVTKQSDNSVTNIAVDALTTSYCNKEVITCEEAFFTTNLHAHFWTGNQGGSTVTVPVENGAEYTYTVQYKAAGSSVGALANGVRIMSGETPAEGVTYDKTTSTVTYKFTATSDSVKLEFVTYDAAGDVAKDSGMQYGDAHCWFASPKLVKADGSSIEVNIKKWSFYYGDCNHEVVKKNESIFSTAPQQVHAYTSNNSAVSYTVAVEQSATYTFSTLYNAKGSSAGLKVGGVRIITGLTPQNGAEFDPLTGKLTYTFVAEGSSVALTVTTSDEKNMVATDSGMKYNDVHIWFGDTQLEKADGTKLDVSAGKWSGSYINYEVTELDKDFFVQTDIQGHIWTSGCGGAELKTTVKEGSEYTFTVAYKAKGSSAGVIVDGTRIITGQTGENGAVFDSESGILTYTFTAKSTALSCNVVTYNSDLTVSKDSGMEYGDVHVWYARPTLTETDGESIDISVNKWNKYDCNYALAVTDISFFANVKTTPKQAHAWTGMAGGMYVTANVTAGETYTFTALYKHAGSTVGAIVDSTRIITAEAPENGATFDELYGKLSYTFTASSDTVTLQFVTYDASGNVAKDSGMLYGDAHLWFAEPTLVSESGTAVDIDVPLWSTSAGYVNCAITDEDPSLFVPSFVIGHLWGGDAGVAQKAVAVEKGKTYTFSTLYKYAGSSAGVIVDGQRVITASNVENGATYDPKTSRLTYQFTASSDEIMIQYVNFNKDSTVIKDSGMEFGDVHVWFADLSLTDTDGNVGEIDIRAWEFHWLNGKIYAGEAEFFENIPQTGHVWTSSLSGASVSATVESGATYTFSMLYKFKGSSAGISVDGNRIMVGNITKNGAIYNPNNGEITYTFTAQSNNISIALLTYDESGNVAKDSGMFCNDVHMWYAEPTLVKADGTAVDINVTKWAKSTSDANYETYNYDESSNEFVGDTVQGHIWTSNCGGAVMTADTVQGKEYTFTVLYKAKGSSAGLSVDGKRLVTGNELAEGVSFDGKTGRLSYTFTASSDKTVFEFKTYTEALEVFKDSGMEFGDVHIWFADPTLTDEDNSYNIAVQNWQANYCNYAVEPEDRAFFLPVAAISGNIVRHSTSEASAVIDLIKADASASARTLFVTEGSYTIDGIEYGDYILRVTLKNHVTENYKITVDSASVTQDIELWQSGDATKDGNVDIKDLVRLKKTFANNVTETGVYDVNCDGEFNALDMSALVKKLLSCGDDAAMYIAWNEADRNLQVVQEYSDTEDFVMIMKPQSLNEIFNIAPGKFLASTGNGINSDLSSAYYRNDESFVESDWFGPHIINGDWTGGTHVTNDGTMHTGRTADITLAVDGKEVTGDVNAYADTLKICWNNELYFTGTETCAMIEHYTMFFDGSAWQVDCSLEVVADLSWKSYYGIQCVYGYWYDNIYFNGGEAKSINVPASGSSSYNVDSNIKLVDTMTVNKGSDWLEMGIDRAYGLGDRRYVDGNNGAFAINYGSPNSGKAYFNLVNSNETVAMKAGDTIGYRGFYRFYSQ